MNSIKRIKRKYLLISILIFLGYYFSTYVILTLYYSSIFPSARFLNPLLFILLLIVVYVTRITYLKSINNVLSDDISLVDYRSYLQSTVFITKSRKLQQQLGIAFLDYLEGDFETSLVKLTEIEPDIMQKKGRSGDYLKLFYYRYRFLSSIFAKKDIDFEQFKQNISTLNIRNQDMKQRLLEEQLSLYEILHYKKENAYFEKTLAKNRLQQVQYCYFNALNAQLNQYTDKLKQLYTDLSQENERLFFVKEAKAYLASVGEE